MSEQKYLLERIKRVASKAIEAERDGNLEVAFDMFLKAAELLNEIKLGSGSGLQDSGIERVGIGLNRTIPSVFLCVLAALREIFHGLRRENIASNIGY